MSEVLSGVRVLDLSSYIAGPYCTKILADFGADVIKVEPPEHGDVSRRWQSAPGVDERIEMSPLFLHLNTNKQGVTLDVKSEAGAAILKQLVDRADLIVDDGVLASAAGDDWSYEALSAENERLVLTLISPFGPAGPYRDYQASDIVVAAMGGWMYPMGDPGRPPLQPGSPYVQYVAGSWAAAGTLTALLTAAISGLGQQVDISMMEAAAATTVEDMVRHSYTGEERGRYGHQWGAGILNSLQPCADGHALVMGGPNRDQVFTLLGLDALPAEERPDGEDLEREIQSYSRGRTRDEFFHEAQALRLPFAPVATPHDVLHSPQLLARDYFREISHQEAGRLLHTGLPYHLSGAPGTESRPAPTLGQDNERVYLQLPGVDAAQLSALRDQGVI